MCVILYIILYGFINHGSGGNGNGRVLVIAFGCGHSFHDSCVHEDQVCPLCAHAAKQSKGTLY